MTTGTMGRLEWALLLLLSVFWGASFFFYKLLVSLGPFTVVLGRMGIAAAVMIPVLYAQGGRLPPLRDWGPFFILALLNCVIPFSLFAFSERHISSGLASIINAMTPIFTVLVAHFWTHNEKLAWNKAIGVGFGLAGVVILIGPAALSDAGGNDLLGELACLLATVSYGFSGVYAKRFSKRPLNEVVTCQFTAATILVIPLALVLDQPWIHPMPGLAVWASLFGIAVISTVVAYLIYFHILAKAGATNISLVTFLIPASGVFLGVAFLGETVSATAMAGIGVIALGLAAIDGRPLRWLKRATQRAVC
jgi:drug/metabolite transporter (DMT)-like permease